nr:hypothetical protein [Streptomyces yatensis]
MTATPCPAPLPPAFLARTSRVRGARPEDATALAELSRPFVRSGALRERPVALYATRAADFLVAEAPDGTVEGCVGLRAHPAETPCGGADNRADSGSTHDMAQDTMLTSAGLTGRHRGRAAAPAPPQSYGPVGPTFRENPEEVGGWSPRGGEGKWPAGDGRAN